MLTVGRDPGDLNASGNMSELSAPSVLPQLNGSATFERGLLEDVGLSVINVSHFFLKNARELPFPLGRTIRCAENTLSYVLDPIIPGAQELSLKCLSRIDKKVEALAKHIPFALVFIDTVHTLPYVVSVSYDELRQEGIFYFTRNILNRLKSGVNNRVLDLLKLSGSVPGVSLAVSVYECVTTSSPSILLANSPKIEEEQSGSNDLTADIVLLDEKIEPLSDLKLVEAKESTEEPLAVEHMEPKLEEFEVHTTRGTESEADSIKRAESTNVSTDAGESGETTTVVVSDTGEGSSKNFTLDDTLEESSEEEDEIMDLFNLWSHGALTNSPSRGR